jgi:hypothetical protein
MRVSRRFLTALALLALLHYLYRLALVAAVAARHDGLVSAWLALLASFLMMPLALFARGGATRNGRTGSRGSV